MANPSDYIAIFDSGVGGISVLKQLVKQLPNERFLYFGDSANAPYGTRPAKEIQQLCIHVAEKLIAQGIKALVVACNTATAAAVELLRQRYSDLIIVGIEPAIKLAADTYPGGRVGVMATPVTLQEEKFRLLAQRCADRCSIVTLSAPGLADLVEAGKGNSEESEALIRSLLEPWVGKLDAVVLGCTHYPFVTKTLKKVLGDTPLLDGSLGTAQETRRQLERRGLLHEGPGEIIIQNSSLDTSLLRLSWELLEE